MLLKGLDSLARRYGKTPREWAAIPTSECPVEEAWLELILGWACVEAVQLQMETSLEQAKQSGTMIIPTLDVLNLPR